MSQYLGYIRCNLNTDLRNECIQGRCIVKASPRPPPPPTPTNTCACIVHTANEVEPTCTIGFQLSSQIHFHYTPDIQSMLGYIVFAFPFVGLSVRSYVHLFIRSSFRHIRGHRVKVFALKFIRPDILKTLWWISFIFGLMVDIGLKFLSAPSQPQGWPWGQGHGLRIFIKKVKIFCA